MGEGKRRAAWNPRHRDIRSGAFRCIYCSGKEVATEVEHMPPIAMFRNRWRPNDLIFPSCTACNKGSRELDQIIALLSRIYPDGGTEPERQETRKFISSVYNNCPEVFSGILPLVDRSGYPETRAGMLDLSDRYIVRCMQVFGAKLGLALHYHETGAICPDTGGMLVYWFTNAHLVKDQIPAGIFEIFNKRHTLRQGSRDVGDQFTYSSVSDDSTFSSHIATFRQSFMFWVLISDKTENLPEYEDDMLVRPGCLKDGYPYGLPKLSQLQIDGRLRERRRMFAAYKS
jgi:hypothetical protein